MGYIDIKQVASFTGLQSKMFTVPEGFAGIKGIFIRGANLSKALIEASDGIHRSTIPCRDIATQTDPEEVRDSDFCPLNWRLPPGTSIDITPTTSSATVGTVMILFAMSLSDPEYEVKHKNFNSTSGEPVDLIQVPDGKTTLDYSFCRGPDFERMKCQAGNKIFHIFGRHAAVNADPLPFTMVKTATVMQSKTMIQAIEIDHGTGGVSDLFMWFR